MRHASCMIEKSATTRSLTWIASLAASVMIPSAAFADGWAVAWLQPEIFHAVEMASIETTGSITVLNLASALPASQRFQTHRFDYIVDKVEIDCDKRTIRRLERRLYLTGATESAAVPVEPALPGEADLSAPESDLRRWSVLGTICGGPGRYTAFPTLDEAIWLWRTTRPSF